MDTGFRLSEVLITATVSLDIRLFGEEILETVKMPIETGMNKSR